MNTTELDIKKACRMNKPANKNNAASVSSEQAIENLMKEVAMLKSRLDRSNFKMSKVSES